MFIIFDEYDRHRRSCPSHTSMHVTSSFARKSPCHLLRESYWQDGKFRKRTLIAVGTPVSQRIAVGKPVALLPPHRTVRAR